ncbi:hypothetical protein HaLaN_15604, partial [Haematococcus lacustris]
TEEVNPGGCHVCGVVQKKVAKAYTDGILVLSEGNAATLYSLDNGKVVTQGRARRASLREIMPAGSNKPSKKKKKGASGDSDDGSQDEEDEAAWSGPAQCRAAGGWQAGASRD